MKLIVAGSGSQGNSYILKANDGEMLIIEAGVSIKAMMPLIDFQISKVKLVIVSHKHHDHDSYSKDWHKRGIQVSRPFEESYIPQSFIPQPKNSQFDVRCFSLQDSNGNWVHSNGDGSECPVYGFLIYHPEMGYLVYASDCEFIKWRFPKINHFLIEANYDLDELENDGEAKNRHVFSGHHSIQAACKFMQVNQSDALKNVILCHLSEDNGSPVNFTNKMIEVVGENTNVYVAKKGLEIEL